MITDIWFRSPLSLEEMARLLDLSDVVHDSENTWEWVIGRLSTARLDVTRNHRLRRSATDTRIFVLGDGANGVFDAELAREVVARLRKFVRGPIHGGRWVYRSGNDFDRITVETF
jgi:hypothetical protein